MQRDRHVNNHEAAIFLRTTALEHGWLNELLKMGERESTGALSLRL